MEGKNRGRRMKDEREMKEEGSEKERERGQERSVRRRRWKQRKAGYLLRGGEHTCDTKMKKMNGIA